MTVTLREVTRDSGCAVCRLDAGDGGAQVAPNALSIAQAYFCPEAWFRAIHADDELVGFLMFYDPSLTAAPEEPHFYLWRLMIDRAHQGRGHGRAALAGCASAWSGATIAGGAFRRATDSVP